jgi:hypothetical protein
MAADTSLPLLSFPAILRNPGITDRYAHLHDTRSQGNTYKSHPTHTSINKNRRDQNEGKRWVRRKDNGQFIALNLNAIPIIPSQLVSLAIRIS